MLFPTVIVYDRSGLEITSEAGIEGMKKAKERASYLLSDRFADSCETTHERMETMKVAIFAERENTGANVVCEWDRYHPQHEAWLRAQAAKELEAEAHGR